MCVGDREGKEWNLVGEGRGDKGRSGSFHIGTSSKH